jgi:hypothetical protein
MIIKTVNSILIQYFKINYLIKLNVNLIKFLLNFHQLWEIIYYKSNR